MIVGGLRHRLVHDSFRELVAEGLSTLGWFDEGRYHKPVTLLAEPKNWDEVIVPNAVAIEFIGSDPYEVEVGSRLTTDVTVAYVDIYAQNEALGTHLSNDVRDWIRGRLQATPVGVTFPIRDYRDPTPSVIGYMDIRNVTALRNVAINLHMWLRHWFRVRCEISDTYATSEA